jgi:hypothetical protein
MSQLQEQTNRIQGLINFLVSSAADTQYLPIAFARCSPYARVCEVNPMFVGLLQGGADMQHEAISQAATAARQAEAAVEQQAKVGEPVAKFSTVP